ncbi:calmodulin, partial [Moniliophthora roreri]
RARICHRLIPRFFRLCYWRERRVKTDSLHSSYLFIFLKRSGKFARLKDPEDVLFFGQLSLLQEEIFGRINLKSDVFSYMTTGRATCWDMESHS